MMCANEEKTWSERRAGMMIPFSRKTMWKIEEIFLDIAGSLFNEEDYMNDCTYGVARILGKEGTDACFTFKENALLDSEGLCEVK